MSVLIYIEAFLFIICIILSGFFSSSEVAIVSISRAKVRSLVGQKMKGSKALNELKQNIDHALITILIGNNVVNVLAASVATAIALQIYGEPGIGIATFVTVILMLIIGEIGPKTYAARNTEKLALKFAGAILVLNKIFSPLLWIWDRINSRWGTGFAHPSITEEEIKEWIDVGEEEGAIEQEEREMLYSVLRFSDTTAREIMTPRVDVIMLEDTSLLDEAINVFNETGFSRLPVFHDAIDNIVGVLNVKDAFADKLAEKKDAAVTELMSNPNFIPESKKIDEVLTELKARKMHMAIVLDEYGSFAGIVTIEDTLEELVGDIMDEFDEEEPDIQQVSDNIFLVDAQIWVERLNDELSVNLPIDESYETVGGLVIDRLGHIPRRGEVVKLEGGSITLVVMKMHARRIVQVKIIIAGPDEKSRGS